MTSCERQNNTVFIKLSKSEGNEAKQLCRKERTHQQVGLPQTETIVSDKVLVWKDRILKEGQKWVKI